LISGAILKNEQAKQMASLTETFPMSLLSTINSANDVIDLTPQQLPQLATEVRETIINTISKNGGHLASNLGSVELTIALLRIFSPPLDRIVWDVGHQAYTWKLLTGRREQFSTIRTRGGLSGFIKPDENPCDASIAGHAGTALSTALGMATGLARKGQPGHVLAIIGDASMTNGISLEALNNLEDVDAKVIVILNDNEMSINQNVGALSRSLGRMLTSVRYNRIKAAAEAAGHRMHMTALRHIYHKLEQAIKSIWLKNAFFEEFGLRYIGPIDGHDFNALENALLSARDDKRSVLVHVATQKGRGYQPAEQTPSAWHGVSAFVCETGEQVKGGAKGYSQACGETLLALAEDNPSLVTITAAMCTGTGLAAFAEKYPRRFFDVGICEAHAVVFAAGLASTGYRPVFAVYSSFLQRAVDCVMHDVCIQKLPVLLCIDRAGVVGSDGPTHHGIYDIPMLRCLPNLVMMQPADNQELDAMIRFALTLDGPATIRYPREPGPERGLKECADMGIELGKAEVLSGSPETTIWIWALGDMLPLAHEIAALIGLKGRTAGIVNARFIKPLDLTLLKGQAATATCFITLENGSAAGGFGSAVAETLAANNITTPVHIIGWPDRFMGQGSTTQLREEAGLTAERIVESIQ
jgi:1-deoxy-D-xylulose-5-phosphate synthase